MFSWRVLTGGVIVFLVATAFVALDRPASAEDAAPDASSPEPAPLASGRREIEEIIVTAERRETNLQDTALAVTALGGDDMERREIKGMNDLALQVPGLSMDAVIGVPKIAMRGIGLDFTTLQGEPGVAVYTDGIYQARPYTSLSNFYSIERVEALRGPQGTLFGRNATGGLIHFITKGPSEELEAEVAAMIGSQETIRGRASVSGPVTDWLGVRLGVVSEQTDGYIDNLLDGKTLHGRKILSLRGAMTVDPAPYLNFRVNADWQTDDWNGTAIKALTDNVGTSQGGRRDPDPRKVYHDSDPFTDIQFGGANVHSHLDLGFAAAEAIFGWATSDSDAYYDADGTDAPFFDLGKKTDATQYSGEFHVASPDSSWFRWIGGVFAFHELGSDFLDAPVQRTDAFPQGTATVHQHLDEQKTDSYAVFGQATADLIWDLSLTFGSRFTHDRKRGVETSTIDALGREAVVNCRGLVTRAHWSAFTPKVGLEWRGLDDDSLLYAQWSRGFKGGGVNITGCGSAFDPEYLEAYEAGFKTEWLSGLLQTNVVGFWYDYTDIQTAFSQAVSSITLNAPGATIRGVETELRSIPFSWLSASAAVSYLDARFDEFVGTDERVGEERNFAGNRLPRSPVWKSVVGIDFPLPLRAWGTLTPRIEWAHQTDMYFDFVNNPIDRQPEHSLWNANATFRSADDRFQVNGFGKNLGDELLYTNIQYNTALMGTIAHPGAPRTYGVEMILRF